MEFDADVVSRQLQYTGMLETVKIRQAGYPCRIPINVSCFCFFIHSLHFAYSALNNLLIRTNEILKS